MAIFRLITPDDVLQAISIMTDPAQQDMVRGLGFRPSTERLVYKGEFYHARVVLCIACYVSTGEYPRRDLVRGGGNRGAAPYILGKRGFWVDSGELFDLQYLNVDETHGKRAPYQYILLLWAIAQAYSGEPQFVPFSANSKYLRDLLRPFAISKTTPDPAMPWAALDKTKYWKVNKPPSVRAVDDARVRKDDLSGGLTDRFYGLAKRRRADFVGAAVGVIRKLINECDPAFAPLTEELIESLGLTELASRTDSAAQIDDDGTFIEDFTPSGSPAPSGRSTRLQDPVSRAKIEERSLEVAEDHYEKIGGVNVERIGKPYDLKVVVDGVERHCEVKGSSLLIDTVELTINEVKHRRTYAHVDLIVVDGIELIMDESTGEVRAHGGTPRIWTDWQLDEEALSPKRYDYTLPANP